MKCKDHEVAGGYPIGFFNPVIPTQNLCSPVIPRVIFGTPPPALTFNPESRPDLAFKSRIPSFK